MITKLVGKFFYLGNGEGFHTGEIIDTIETGFLLIRTDPVMDGPSLLRLIDLHLLTFEQDDDAVFCALFDSRKELDVWSAWLDKEPKLKIIHLRNKEESKPEGMV